MKTNITTATALPSAVLEPVLGPVGKAFEEVSASFDRFCLAAGIAALGEMMEKDAAELQALVREGIRKGVRGPHGGACRKCIARISGGHPGNRTAPSRCTTLPSLTVAPPATESPAGLIGVHH